MHTCWIMKKPVIAIVACAACLAPVIFFGEETGETVSSTPPSPVFPSELIASGNSEITAAEARFTGATGMAANYAAEPGEADPVQEMVENGFIIDASIADVTAALESAAATPGIEDDRAATIFAHRASCRFFVEDQGDSAPNEEN